MGSHWLPFLPYKVHRICANPTGAVARGWGMDLPWTLCPAPPLMRIVSC